MKAIALLLLSLCLSQGFGAVVRTLTSDKGAKVEAEILSVDDKGVTIRRLTDDKKFKVPYSLLSPADKNYFQGTLAYFTKPIKESDKFQKGATIVAAARGEVSIIDPPSYDSNYSSESPRTTKRAAKENDVLPPGTQVQTGADSEAILLFSNGTIATVGANTKMLIEAFVQEEFDGADKKVGELLEEVSPSKMRLDLDLGELVMDVKKLNKGSSLSISSPVGIAGIRGTQFRVDANETAVAVSVLTGLVDFLDANNVLRPVGKETRLDATKQAPPKQVAIPAADQARVRTAIQTAKLKTANLTVADLAKSSDEVSGKGALILTDKVFEMVLRNMLNKRTGPITHADLASITNLDNSRGFLERNRLTSFTSLSKLTNLVFLKLPHNGITDVTPLAGLTKLTSLHLGSNQITDINPLVGLTKLKLLDLSSNQITDFTPLARLTKLESLILSNQKPNGVGKPFPLSQRNMLKKALPNTNIRF